MGAKATPEEAAAEEYLDVKTAIFNGDVDGLRLWLRDLDKRAVMPEAARCPYIATEVSAVVLLALEAGELAVLRVVLVHMAAQGYRLHVKYAATICARLAVAEPLPAVLLASMAQFMMPEDRSLMLALFSADARLGPALLESGYWVAPMTPAQRLFDVAKKHFHYRLFKRYMSQGLAGRLAGEWAAVSIAARELRLEEVFGIIHGSFEPILLAMVVLEVSVRMSDLDPLRSALLPLAPHQRSALLAASYSYLQELAEAAAAEAGHDAAPVGGGDENGFVFGLPQYEHVTVLLRLGVVTEGEDIWAGYNILINALAGIDDVSRYGQLYASISPELVDRLHDFADQQGAGAAAARLDLLAAAAGRATPDAEAPLQHVSHGDMFSDEGTSNAMTTVDRLAQRRSDDVPEAAKVMLFENATAILQSRGRGGRGELKTKERQQQLRQLTRDVVQMMQQQAVAQGQPADRPTAYLGLGNLMDEAADDDGEDDAPASPTKAKARGQLGKRLSAPLRRNDKASSGGGGGPLSPHAKGKDGFPRGSGSGSQLGDDTSVFGSAPARTSGMNFMLAPPLGEDSNVELPASSAFQAAGSAEAAMYGKASAAMQAQPALDRLPSGGGFGRYDTRRFQQPAGAPPARQENVPGSAGGHGNSNGYGNGSAAYSNGGSGAAYGSGGGGGGYGGRRQPSPIKEEAREGERFPAKAARQQRTASFRDTKVW